MTTMTEDLDALRQKIDALDASLLELLAQRARLVDEIGRYKKARNLEPLDANRWRQVLDNNIQRAQSLDLCPEFIEGLYHLIHEYSLKLESHSEPDS
jgi:chorismate mutase